MASRYNGEVGLSLNYGVVNDECYLLVKNLVYYKRTKHSVGHYHHLHEVIKDDKVHMSKVGMKEKLADMLTKMVWKWIGMEFDFCRYCTNMIMMFLIIMGTDFLFR